MCSFCLQCVLTQAWLDGYLWFSHKMYLHVRSICTVLFRWICFTLQFKLETYFFIYMYITKIFGVMWDMFLHGLKRTGKLCHLYCLLITHVHLSVIATLAEEIHMWTGLFAIMIYSFYIQLHVALNTWNCIHLQKEKRILFRTFLSYICVKLGRTSRLVTTKALQFRTLKPYWYCYYVQNCNVIGVTIWPVRRSCTQT